MFGLIDMARRPREKDDGSLPEIPPHNVILCCDCEGTERQLTRIHRVISKAAVPANYFFVGETIRDHPALCREIAEVHQTESHTDSHPNLRAFGIEDQRLEILGGKHAVEDLIQRPTRGFRAPMHQLNRDTVRILNEEGFVFDASKLYYRYLDMGDVIEVWPTWFREWMPLYEKINLPPKTAFAWFSTLTKWRRLSVLPIHPHYAGKSDELAKAFLWFLRDCQKRDVRFWSIDAWLAATRGLPMPEWRSPLETAAPVSAK